MEPVPATEAAAPPGQRTALRARREQLRALQTQRSQCRQAEGA